jgi:hypothetical protein
VVGLGAGVNRSYRGVGVWIRGVGTTGDLRSMIGDREGAGVARGGVNAGRCGAGGVKDLLVSTDLGVALGATGRGAARCCGGELRAGAGDAPREGAGDAPREPPIWTRPCAPREHASANERRRAEMFEEFMVVTAPVLAQLGCLAGRNPGPLAVTLGYRAGRPQGRARG